MLGTSPLRPGPDDLQPVRGVRQLPLAPRGHRTGHRGRPGRDHGTGRPLPRRDADHRFGRHDCLRRLPEEALAGQQDRRQRGAAMPDVADERLRRAPHRGHWRQARAVDSQRQEHRHGDRDRRRGQHEPDPPVQRTGWGGVPGESRRPQRTGLPVAAAGHFRRRQPAVGHQVRQVLRVDRKGCGRRRGHRLDGPLRQPAGGVA